MPTPAKSPEPGSRRLTRTADHARPCRRRLWALAAMTLMCWGEPFGSPEALTERPLAAQLLKSSPYGSFALVRSTCFA
jgi:hypothetical protein